MCGIAGLVGHFESGLGSRMNAAQAHRGPDGSGVFEDLEAEAMLAHVRLAILDLTPAAAQPMHSADGRWVLSYNGEIYNFRELRTELEQAGESFRSSGDTEVLLRGLARHGPGFLERLNGIFALALWDRQERTLLLARDPLGVKPLYYAEPVPGAVLFASEIKALFAYSGLTRAPNFAALQEHLARSHASGVHTAFQGVRRLPAGAMLVWRAGRHHVKTYWEPDFAERPNSSYGQCVEMLRAAIAGSVARQMVADVPVGSFLSGGLDSSLITLLAAGQTNQEFQCYTITYPSSENVLDQFVDDTPHAFAVSQLIGKTHILLNIRPHVADLLPKLVWHMDEPNADPAIIAAFLISQFARRNGTVVLLSGQGADEIFGGYPRYRAVNIARQLRILPRPALAAMADLTAHLPAGIEGRAGALLRRARRVAVEMSESPDTTFMNYCSTSSDRSIERILHPDVRAVLCDRVSAKESLELLRASPAQGGNRYLHRDMADYLPNHNLLYMDKMSMAAGVEARVPLLDREVVELANRTPYEWKVKGAKLKRVLRDAARGIVPDSILRRKKAGFGAPYRKWLRYDLKPFWEEIASEASIRRRGWFDPAGVREIRRLSDEGKVDLYMLQWAVLTVELWARQFFDRDPATSH